MEWLKKLLGEDLYNKVVEALKGKGKDGKDVELLQNDGNYIPKVKFDEKLEEAKTLKGQLDERDKQLKDLAEKAKGNEDLTKQIADLQEANKNAVTDYENKLKQQAFEFAVESAIGGVKGKDVNPRAIKALLKIENIKLDGEKLIGFEDQITELKKTDAYLFEAGSPSGGGFNPPGGGSGKKNPWKTDSFNLTEQGRTMKENPALAKALIIEAGGNPQIYGL